MILSNFLNAKISTKILFTDFDFVELLSVPIFQLINAKSVLQTTIAGCTEHADFRSVLTTK